MLTTDRNKKSEKVLEDNMKNTIESGKAVLGIEFGSTRIKAILIDEKNQVIGTVWPGKSDIYHALQAMLIPYQKVGVSIGTVLLG